MRGQQPRARDDINLLLLLQRREFQLKQAAVDFTDIKPAVRRGVRNRKIAA